MEAPPPFSFKHLKYGSQTASIAKPLPRFELFQQVHLSATKRCSSVCCPTALVWCRCHISGVAPPFSPPPDLCLPSPIPPLLPPPSKLAPDPAALLPNVIHYCSPLKYSICTYSHLSPKFAVSLFALLRLLNSYRHFTRNIRDYPTVPDVSRCSPPISTFSGGNRTGITATPHWIASTKLGTWEEEKRRVKERIT